MDTPEALATLRRVLGADPDVVDRHELTELVRSASRLRALLDGFDIRCSRRARQLAEAGRSEAPSSLLGRNGNRSQKEARKLTRREGAGRQMPAFEKAMGSGEVSAEHLDVIANTGTGLPDEVRLAFIDHEAELLDAARGESVEAFTRRCRTLIRRITADLAGPDDDAELDRQRDASNVKRWTDTATGMCHTHLELDPVRDAEMWSGIDAHIARIRSDGSTKLTWAHLQVEAVVDAVSAGVTVDHDRNDTNALDDGAACTDDGGGTAANGSATPGDTAAPAVYGDPSTTAAEIGGRLATTIAARTRATVGRVARIPQPAQRVPEIIVLVGLDVLTNGADALGDSITGLCETVDGRQLPVSTVRRMCCDAEIIPAVLNGNGEVTDLGRSRRTANRAQRRQLAAMHRTCAHPDCTVAFSACRIHHVKWWWRDLGDTDIANLLPLCEHHHHLVHEGGWGLSLDAGRIATWNRPDGTRWHTGPTVDRTVIDRSPTHRPAADPPANRPFGTLTPDA